MYACSVCDNNSSSSQVADKLKSAIGPVGNCSCCLAVVVLLLGTHKAPVPQVMQSLCLWVELGFSAACSMGHAWCSTYRSHAWVSFILSQLKAPICCVNIQASRMGATRRGHPSMQACSVLTAVLITPHCPLPHFKCMPQGRYSWSPPAWGRPFQLQCCCSRLACSHTDIRLS
jgi:hypothetical protein